MTLPIRNLAPPLGVCEFSRRNLGPTDDARNFACSPAFVQVYAPIRSQSLGKARLGECLRLRKENTFGSVSKINFKCHAALILIPNTGRSSQRPPPVVDTLRARPHPGDAPRSLCPRARSVLKERSHSGRVVFAQIVELNIQPCVLPFDAGPFWIGANMYISGTYAITECVVALLHL